MSNRSSKYDLTQGDILSKLLVVAVPIMGSQLMQMSYNLADMFWLGRWGNGQDAVAASGTAGTYMWLSMAFVAIGRMGAEIGVAQSLGRGDPHGAKRYAQNALFLAIVLGTLVGIAMVTLRAPLVAFFQIQEAHVAGYAESYLAIVGLAMPFNFVMQALVGCFNASGNSRAPFIVNAIGLVINMILDPLMIFTFGWGIAGAAIATSVSQVLSFVLMLLFMKKSKNRPFERFAFFRKPEMVYIRRILAWSVPIGLESAFFTLMSMIPSRLISGFGTSAMAVSRVGSQIESLSWLIGGGFGSALTAFMGQNYGAGKWTRIHKGFSLSTMAMTVWGIAITVFIFFGGGFLFSLFLPDDQTVISMGATYLRILAICQIPQCFEAVSGSTFKGIGKTIPPSIVSIISNILRAVLAYILSRTALGLHGIWIAIAFTATLRGVWGFIWYLIASKKLPKEDVVASTATA